MHSQHSSAKKNDDAPMSLFAFEEAMETSIRLGGLAAYISYVSVAMKTRYDQKQLTGEFVLT